VELKINDKLMSFELERVLLERRQMHALTVNDEKLNSLIHNTGNKLHWDMPVEIKSVNHPAHGQPTAVDNKQFMELKFKATS
jgi:hypothetical protein